MTNIKPYTTTPTKTTSQYDYILLDGSSSMTLKWLESINAIDAYINRCRDLNLNSQIVLSQFAGSYLDWTMCDTPIHDWMALSATPPTQLGGTTPLYSAINVMCRKLRDLDPPRCAITIVTDGEADTGDPTSVIQAKALLDWCRAKGWQVTFIGCDFNNSHQAGLLGANPSSAIGVSQKRLTDAARNLAEKRQKYALYGTDMHFTGDEKQQFGGYLNGPSSPTIG